MSPDGSTKSLPPEERLLRLLRGKRAEPAPAQPPPPQPAAGGSLAVPSGQAAVLPAWSWLRAVSIGLGVVLALEVAVMIAEVARPLPEIRIPEVRTAPPEASVTEPVTLPSLAETASRPLFTATSVGPETAATRSMPSGTAQALSARLTLLGIVPGDPAQAIIEDTGTSKTYFVTVGQQVVEGAVLDAVRDTHVVLDFQGEKIELAL